MKEGGRERKNEGEIGENDRWAQRREGCWVQHCGRAEHMTALQWALCVCLKACILLPLQKGVCLHWTACAGPCVSWLNLGCVCVCVHAHAHVRAVAQRQCLPRAVTVCSK